MRLLVINLAVVVAASAVYAQSQSQKHKGMQIQTPQGTVDLTKMGPWTRKVSNEQQVNKEITDFLKKEEEVMKSGDFNTAISRIDFPVVMITDDSKGVPMAREYSREEYVSMMKPMYESWPKDMKVNHKHEINVLSDSLATVNDNFTMTMNQQKLSGRSHALLVKRDGRWMWKSMAEPGWGDMSAAGAYGSDPQQKHMQQDSQQKQQHNR